MKENNRHRWHCKSCGFSTDAKQELDEHVCFKKQDEQASTGEITK